MSEDAHESGCGLPICLCCEEKQAARCDDNVGEVCLECFTLLGDALGALVITPGIDGCTFSIHSA